MITNDDLYKLMVFITDAEETGKFIYPHQFNRILKRNSILKFKKELGLPENFYYGQPTTRTAYEVTQRVSDLLRPFKVNNNSLSVSGGSATIPANYFYVTGVRYSYSSTIRSVEILTDSQFADRQENSITNPTEKDPVCRFLSSTIEFLPSTISSVQITYLRLPNEPDAVYKNENGITVYDSGNSTELEWDDVAKIDILNMMMRDVAPNLDPSVLGQYTQQLTDRGA